MTFFALVLSGAIVFLLGIVAGFLFACWGAYIILRNDGYMLSGNKIRKKSDVQKEEQDMLMRFWK